MKNTQMTNIAKGVAAGLVVGTAATMIGAHTMKNSKKSVKKKAGHAVKAFGDFIDNVSYMMK